MKTRGVRVMVLLTCVLAFGLSHAEGVLPAAVSPAADTSKISVFVFTQAPVSRMTTLDEQARHEALQQLTHYLRKKHRLVLVNDGRTADVVIELLSSLQLFKPNQKALFDDRALITDVTAGARKTRITASRYGVEATAQNLAGRIDTWIRENVKPRA